MFERFTAAARATVIRAVEQAGAMGSSTIRPAHLLLALCADPGLAGQILQTAGLTAEQIRAGLPGAPETLDRDALLSVGIDLDDVRRTIEENFGPGALESASPSSRRRRNGRHPRRAGRLPFDTGAKTTLELGLREAVQLRSPSLGAEHLLLGLLHGGDREVSTLLAAADVDADGLRHNLLDRMRCSA